MPIWKKIKRDKGKRRTAVAILQYMFREKGAELILTRNLYGTTIEEWAPQFEQQFENWKTKKSISDEVRHATISMSKKEDENLLTQEFWEDVARYAYKLLGGDMHLVVVRHKQHIHLCYSTSHITTNREVRIEGHRYTKFKEMRIELERFIHRKYPEIKYSFVYAPELKVSRERIKEEMKLTDGDYRTRSSGREWRKGIIREVVLGALENSQSYSQFRKAIKENGLRELIRNRRQTGIVYPYRNSKGVEKTMKVRFSTIGLQQEYERFLEREELQLRLERERGQKGKEIEREQRIERDQVDD